MTPPLPAPALFRVTILLAALLGAASPTAQAAGRNHDLQPVLIPPLPCAVHDRAPGPMIR